MKIKIKKYLKPKKIAKTAIIIASISLLLSSFLPLFSLLR